MLTCTIAIVFSPKAVKEGLPKQFVTLVEGFDRFQGRDETSLPQACDFLPNFGLQLQSYDAVDMGSRGDTPTSHQNRQTTEQASPEAWLSGDGVAGIVTLVREVYALSEAEKKIHAPCVRGQVTWDTVDLLMRHAADIIVGKVCYHG